MPINSNLPIKIKGRNYQADLMGFGVAPVESQRQLQDVSRDLSDASLSSPVTWKRTQADWSYGAGQKVFDAEDSDRRRFRYSSNVNIWDKGRISLLNDVDSVAIISAAATGHIVVTEANDDARIFVGANAYNWDGSTLTFENTFGGTVLDAVVIGNTVYAALDSSAIVKSVIGTTSWSAFGTTQPDAVGTGAGRLVAGQDAELFELDNAGAKSNIYTHFDAAFRWNVIVSGPNGIYAFGRDAARSVGYLIQVEDATGALAPPVPVVQMPDAEFINDVLDFGGTFVLATSKGFRLALVNGDGTLNLGALVDSVGATTALATDGLDVWFDANETTEFSSITGLGRMRPSRFTDTLVPAYASDLQSSAGPVLDVAIFNGLPLFLSQVGGTVGLYKQSSLFAGTGIIVSGAISYQTPESKLVHSIDLQYEERLDDSQADIRVAPGVGEPTVGADGGYAIGGASSVRATPTVPLESDEFEVWVVLGATTPFDNATKVRRWTLRAMVQNYRHINITLALKLESQITHQQAGGGQLQIEQDPLAEYEYLVDLMQSREIVAVEVGSKSYQCIVDYVGMGPDVQSVGAKGWTKQQDWVEGTWAVRLLTVEPTT